MSRIERIIEAARIAERTEIELRTLCAYDLGEKVAEACGLSKNQMRAEKAAALIAYSGLDEGSGAASYIRGYHLRLAMLTW